MSVRTTRAPPSEHGAHSLKRPRHLTLSTSVRVVALLLAWLAEPSYVAAQTRETWNDARVLALVRRGQNLRHSAVVDSTFRSYQAQARGYVYFFLDRPDTGERTLVKADQLAVNVYWQAPNRTHQSIVGRRDRKVLPTTIRYHLDHLTVVQDDFGDYIRLGNGDEVAQVLHPLGPGAEQSYDYLLSDSLSLRYGGEGREVRVYEVRVRPRDPDAPGFIGSVYLDREHAAIVRMAFTFTPASYVDPYLDHIRISLDNSLWMGRYWLPYRQEVELRRELPALDFEVGSVIRGRWEIGDYEFNTDLPRGLLAGPKVTIAPRRDLAAFRFRRDLFADLDQEGLAPTPSLANIRAEAEQVLRQRYLGGLSRSRLHIASFSDALRYDRAEGLFVGVGGQLRFGGQALLRSDVGYSAGRRRPSGSVSVSGGSLPVVPTLHAYWDGLRDLGPVPGSSGAVNTLSTLAFSRDHLDPYFVRGVRLTLAGSAAETGSRLSLRWEDDRSARDVVGAGEGERPVLPVDEGILRAVDGLVDFAAPAGGRGTLEGTVGRLEQRTFATVLGRGRWRLRREGEPGWRAEIEALAGAATEQAPVQSLYFLGGRSTLPGYPFRGFAGDRFWLVRAVATHPLLRPWVGLRTFAAVGQTRLGPHTLPTGWDPHDSGGPRASVGAGLALGWDVLHLDLGRGLQAGGDWELTFSVSSRFHPWL